MENVKKIYTWDEMKTIREKWKIGQKEVVFTNGCFDLLHPGHISLLEAAKSLGDRLIVAVNSDDSVRRIKGPARPIIPHIERAEVLGGLDCVDAVVIFEQDDPLKIIKLLDPDILVKGGDWKIENIIGADVVLAKGKKVEIIPLDGENSTTGVLERIRRRMGDNKDAEQSSKC